MTNKWLNKMEEELNSDHGGCKVDNVLHCLGYKKDNHGCPPCEQCKKESQEIIAKIRKEVSEQKQVVKKETSDTSSDTSSETQQELDKDNVNHPSHYNVHKHECIDEMIALYGVEETMIFCKLNAHKYRYRVGAKDSEAREKDFAKADWYIDKFMELKEKKLKKTQKKEKESKGVSVKNNNPNKKKRKYFRKCGVCGNKLEQSDMVRTNKSDNGWACEMCYNELTEPVYDENEF